MHYYKVEGKNEARMVKQVGLGKESKGDRAIWECQLKLKTFFGKQISNQTETQNIGALLKILYKGVKMFLIDIQVNK